MGTVSRGARARGSMGRSVPRHPGIARCDDATNQAHVAGPDQRPSGSGWDLGRLFRPRLSAGLPVAPVLRGSEPLCLSGPDRRWVDAAAALLVLRGFKPLAWPPLLSC